VYSDITYPHFDACAIVGVDTATLIHLQAAMDHQERVIQKPKNQNT
jgi:hypothetical protein